MQPQVIHLSFVSDWGTANFVRVMGWLAAGLRRYYAPDSTFCIYTSAGVVENVHKVGAAEVDVGIVTPPANAWLAAEGKGPFEGCAYPALRAIGKLPHPDRLVCAIARELGVECWADIKAKRVPLRLATQLDPRTTSIGFAVGKVLEFYGLGPQELEAWGGGIVPGVMPSEAVRSVIQGHANGVFHEAIMLPVWQQLAESRPLRFLGLDEDLLEELATRYGYRRAVIPRGFLPGLDEDLLCLDWADWLIVAREEMEFDLAYRMAQVMVETKTVLDGMYGSIPVRYSPLTYPLDPQAMARDIMIPLHRGAEAYFKEARCL